MAEPATSIEVSEEDRLRADLYDFLGLLLSGPASSELIAKTKSLAGDDSDLGAAVGALARVVQGTGADGATAQADRAPRGLAFGRVG